MVEKDYNTTRLFLDGLKDAYGKIKSKFGMEVDSGVQETIRLLERAVGMRKAGSGAYKIKTLPDGRKYVQADREVIFSNNPENWGKELEDYINKSIRKGEDVELITDDGETIRITEDTAWKIGDMSEWSEETFPTKMNMGTHIDELLQVSNYDGNKDAGDRTGKRFKPDSFDYRIAFFRDFNGDYYRVNLSIGVFEDGKVGYSIGKDIQKRNFPGFNGSSPGNQGRSNTKKVSNNNITHPEGSVNSYSTQNSEKDANEKTEMQLALERAGIDSDTFTEEGPYSINNLTPEQVKAVKEAETIQTEMERHIRTMGEEEADTTPLGRKLDRAAMNWVDRFRLLQRFDEYTEKKTGTKAEGKDSAYTMAMNSLNAEGSAMYIIKNGITDLEGNVNKGKGLFKILKPLKSKQEMADFEMYLVARHGAEWLSSNKGGEVKVVFGEDTLDNPEKLKIVAENFERKYPQFKSIAEEIYEFQRAVLFNFGVEGGLLGKNTAEHFFELYPDYVPFYRDIKKMGQGDSIQKEFADLDPGIMKAKGGSAQIISPIESIISNTAKFVTTARKNAVMQAIFSKLFRMWFENHAS